MIAVHLLHPARALARLGRLAWEPFLHPAQVLARLGRLVWEPVRPRLDTAWRPGGSLEGVDRRTLADIGIGRGAIVSLPRQIGLDGLRRPPHL